MTDKEHTTNNFAKDINAPSKEQVIIDGVDVSECEHFDDLKCMAYRAKHAFLSYCESFPFCNFKKLAYKILECNILNRKNQELEQERLRARNAYICTWQAINSYRKAFEKIKFEATEELKYLDADTDVYGCLMAILNIINKAGFNKSERCETRHSESCVVPVEPSIIQEAKGKNHEI